MCWSACRSRLPPLLLPKMDTPMCWMAAGQQAWVPRDPARTCCWHRCAPRLPAAGLDPLEQAPGAKSPSVQANHPPVVQLILSMLVLATTMPMTRCVASCASPLPHLEMCPRMYGGNNRASLRLTLSQLRQPISSTMNHHNGSNPRNGRGANVIGMTLVRVFMFLLSMFVKLSRRTMRLWSKIVNWSAILVFCCAILHNYGGRLLNREL